MLTKTQGIVFSTTKYSESSIIAKIYTNDRGLQSYIASGVRSKKPKFSPNLFQAASIVELVANYKPNANLNRITEIKSHINYISIPFEISKSTTIIFLTEILSKCIIEESADQNLFNYIKKSFIYFDETNRSLPEFHIIFLIKLTQYLGFKPNGKYSEENPYFDLREGTFCSTKPKHFDFLIPLLSTSLSEINQSTDFSDHLKITKAERMALLENIIKYYQIHIPNFKHLNSLSIFKEVFQN